MLLNSEMVSKYLTGYDENNVQQVGVDLTVKSINKIQKFERVSKEDVIGYIGRKTFINDDFYDDRNILELTDITPLQNTYSIGDNVISTNVGYIVEPGLYSITFNEGCKLGESVTGKIVQRSSLLRMGTIIMSSVYDPGFTVDNMGAMMFVEKRIVIEENARVAQIILDENESAELYDGQWQSNGDKK